MKTGSPFLPQLLRFSGAFSLAGYTLEKTSQVISSWLIFGIDQGCKNSSGGRSYLLIQLRESGFRSDNFLLYLVTIRESWLWRTSGGSVCWDDQQD